MNRQKQFVDGVHVLSKSKMSANETSKRAPRITKKKGSGYLRHGAQTIKRIARLSERDRKAVLRALRRSTKSDVFKPKGKSNDVSSNNESQSSVNNDWMNWLVLHGNEKAASADVCGIGKAIGLKFNGDKNNMFDVLSGLGRKKIDGGGDGA